MDSDRNNQIELIIRKIHAVVIAHNKVTVAGRKHEFSLCLRKNNRILPAIVMIEVCSVSRTDHCLAASNNNLEGHLDVGGLVKKINCLETDPDARVGGCSGLIVNISKNDLKH